jgi:hypothetical protein
MNIGAICTSIITLTSTYYGREGGVKVFLSGYKKKLKLGEEGRPISEEDIQKLVKKLIYYNDDDVIPIFLWDDESEIHVDWE